MFCGLDFPMHKTGEVKISFRMKYDYRNLTTALSQADKKDEVMWLTQYVYVNLGTIVDQ